MTAPLGGECWFPPQYPFTGESHSHGTLPGSVEIGPGAARRTRPPGESKLRRSRHGPPWHDPLHGLSGDLGYEVVVAVVVQ